GCLGSPGASNDLQGSSRRSQTWCLPGRPHHGTSRCRGGKTKVGLSRRGTGLCFPSPGHLPDGQGPEVIGGQRRSSNSRREEFVSLRWQQSGHFRPWATDSDHQCTGVSSCRPHYCACSPGGDLVVNLAGNCLTPCLADLQFNIYAKELWK